MEEFFLNCLSRYTNHLPHDLLKILSLVFKRTSPPLLRMTYFCCCCGYACCQSDSKEGHWIELRRLGLEQCWLCPKCFNAVHGVVEAYLLEQRMNPMTIQPEQRWNLWCGMLMGHPCLKRMRELIAHNATFWRQRL